MEPYQFWALIGTLVVGFGWLLCEIHGVNHKIDTLKEEVSKESSEVKSRLSTIETILAMLGYPSRMQK